MFNKNKTKRTERKIQESEIMLPDIDKVKEVDPNNIKAGEPGAKFDAGKIRLHLLKDFKLALMAVGDLATGGADKYSDGGWQHVENGIERYEDAMIVHWLRSGFETFDKDMKVSHATQAVWNAMAWLEFLLREDPVAIERLMNRVSTDRYGEVREL